MRLRMTERGETAPQNDNSPVILSEAKNLFSRPLSFGASTAVILSLLCHSERSEESSLPPQKQRPKDSSSLSLLRMTAEGRAAPRQRGGRAAPQNDSFFPLSFRAGLSF